jgi:hypothetical protein
MDQNTNSSFEDNRVEDNSYVFPRDIANQRMGVYYWKAYKKD